MKKVLVATLLLITLFTFTGCDMFNKPSEIKEEFVDTKKMQELPKIAFRELKQYIEAF